MMRKKQLCMLAADDALWHTIVHRTEAPCLEVPATATWEICENVAIARLQWQKVRHGVHCRHVQYPSPDALSVHGPVGCTHVQLAHSGAHLPQEGTSASAKEYTCACQNFVQVTSDFAEP